MTKIERFESKLYYGIDGCWYWLGCLSYKGYGSFRYYSDRSKRMIGAHRASFMLYKGEIPEGMQALHTCDNPSCVNPDHLFLGTNTDNVRDKVSKSRQYRPIGDKHPQRKLSSNQVLEIRANHGLIMGKDLAKNYGVSADYIFEIWARKSWKHL